MPSKEELQMLEKGKSLEKEIEILKEKNAKRLNAIEDFTNKTCYLKCDIAKLLVKEFAQKLKRKIKSLKVAEDEDYIFKCGFDVLQENLPEIIDELLKEYEK